MPRLQLIEIHDQPWCPAAIRDACTDYLAFVGNLARAPYRPFVERLAVALRATQSPSLLDLCSGGSGPLPQLLSLLSHEHGIHLSATVTDLYPNRERFEMLLGSSEQLEAFPDPVDATAVPETLSGFRTIHNAFHHFPPELARSILADAIRCRRGVAIFEAAGRHPVPMASILVGLPLMVGFTTPFVRPFRWSRLVLTYLLPVLPLILWFDGIVSCLRVYSPAELRALIEAIDGHETFTWDIGVTATGATFCIGYPIEAIGPSLASAGSRS